MSREIKVFKLTNGEEIVAYATERMTASKTEYIIEKPRVMQVMATKQGPQAGLVPWVISAPDYSFTLSEDKYFVAVDAPKDVSDYYMEITSSIKLASSLN